MERGHTQNENDSVHSCIERAMKKVSLFITAQLATLIHTARRSKPYIVKNMASDDFFYFKDLTSQIRNMEHDTMGSKIKWSEIKTITFTKDYPDTGIIQYDYDGPAINFNLFPNLRNCTHEPCLCKLYDEEHEPPPPPQKKKKKKYPGSNIMILKNVIRRM